MLKKIFKRPEIRMDSTDSTKNNNRPSSRDDFWIKEHQRKLNEQQEDTNNNRKEETKNIPLWKNLAKKIISDNNNAKKQKEINREKAKNLTTYSEEIYHEWTKNGKRLYQCSDDIPFSSIKEFIILSTKRGMLDIIREELEDDKHNPSSEHQAEETDKRLNWIKTEIEKNRQDFKNNKLIDEPNINWEELSEKYRDDGTEVDPDERYKVYKDMLRKFNSKEKHIIGLQEIAMQIGKYQERLKETSNNTYRKYINEYQNQFHDNVSTAYEVLTGRQPTADEYTPPWQSRIDTGSRQQTTDRETYSDTEQTKVIKPETWPSTEQTVVIGLVPYSHNQPFSDHYCSTISSDTDTASQNSRINDHTRWITESDTRSTNSTILTESDIASIHNTTQSESNTTPRYSIISDYTRDFTD